MLVRGTDSVTSDEPCVSVKEVIRPAPFDTEPHRFQIIRVKRRDKWENYYVAELQRDLGRAGKFKASEFVIPGCAEDYEPVHVVGELLEIAGEMRGEKPRRPEKSYLGSHMA